MLCRLHSAIKSASPNIKIVAFVATKMLFGIACSFLTRIYNMMVLFMRLHIRKVAQYQTVRYYNVPLSPSNEMRLGLLKRKTMVLDLDETLIHSHHDGSYQPVPPKTPPDFVLRVTIERRPVRFFVYKRPHVDYFLKIVSQWYDLVIFTASLEIYGTVVADKLENKKSIFQRRFFRQHCAADFNGYIKDLSMISPDLSSIFILDNSPSAYKWNPDNAIPITSWFSDFHDTALLDLLPMLDALRFTNDVRSILSRNLHLHLLYSTK
ncbi:CTD nuclear envelope phosphatase 1-like [Dysidea avara]|uniref:CTD nuclear envelope phosphatase 1-like n=1 Tax=Dysidea avara TaxID=196820 RepID=UPI0033173DAF